MKEMLREAKRIYFSDSHIPRCNEFFVEWLIKIIDYSKAKVYGLGDIFELIECTKDEVRNKGIIEMGLLRKLNNIGRLFLLKGNHDMDAGRCLGFPFYTESDRFYYSISGVGFYFMHGHQFDPICKHTWLWNILRHIVPYFVTPGKAKYGQKQKIYDATVKRILNNVYKANISLVFGHTHWAGIILRENGKVIINIGDMLDSCTWLLEHKNGKFYLFKKWEIMAEWPKKIKEV
ncbi:metallophosphoesterase [bacterium]|nr:metallophosphoesterase [bacterium]